MNALSVAFFCIFLLTTVLLQIQAVPVRAQFLRRDSLLRELQIRRSRGSERDSNYARLLFLIARSYRPNTAQMRPFIDEARPLIAALNSPRLHGLLLQNCGNILRLERRFDEARDTLRFAFTIFEQMRDSANMSSTAGLLAVMYQQRDMFATALQYYMQEMEIADKCGDRMNIFLARVNLSEISIAMQQPEKALYFARQAEVALQRSPNAAFSVEWAKSMAAAYRLLQQPDSALKYARQGWKGAWNLRDTVLAVNLMAQEVRALSELKRFSEALVRLDSMIILDASVYGSAKIRPSVCAIAAEVFFACAADSTSPRSQPLSREQKRNYLEKALHYSQSGLSQQLVSKKDMLDLYAVQTRIYSALNQIQEAFRAQSKVLALRDSVFTSSLHAGIADMQERYERKQKETEIGALQAQERRATMLNVLLTSLSLGGLFLAGISYQRFRARQRSEDALHEANTRLQSLYEETLTYKNRIEEQNESLLAQERLLRNSLRDKQFLAIVADSAAQMVVITDAAGYIEFVNAKFEQFTGYTRSEALGQKPGKILQGKNTDKATVQAIRAALHEFRPFEGDIINYTKEGQEYWTHLAISPVLNDRGQCEHFVAIQYDVTNDHRKQDEERLQAELTLQSMIDSTRELTMLVGADFKMIRFNKIAYNAMRAILLGVEPEIGMDMRQYSPIPLAEVERDFADVMNGKSVAFDLDMPNPAKPEEMLTFEVNYNPVRNPQGEIVAVGFVARNITKRRREQAQIEQMNSWLEERVHERTSELEVRALQLSTANNKLATAYSDLEIAQLELWSKNQELEYLNQKLEDASQEKSEILGIVVHDLKSPLSGIQGLADALRTGLDAEFTRQAANEIYGASERMFRLITNLLDVNAIESGKMEVHPAVLDACFLAETVIEAYISRASAKEIRIVPEIPSEPHYVVADEMLLTQALENVVSNAVKYSPPGKKVIVRVLGHSSLGIGHSSDDDISTSVLITNSPITNSRIRIEVEDEGPGISEEDMKKLFGKFARLSAQPTGGEHSTGLGLNIVKKTVEAMKGKVWCESELGKGAKFIVELPKAEV